MQNNQPQNLEIESTSIKMIKNFNRVCTIVAMVMAYITMILYMSFYSSSYAMVGTTSFYIFLMLFSLFSLLCLSGRFFLLGNFLLFCVFIKFMWQGLSSEGVYLATDIYYFHILITLSVITIVIYVAFFISMMMTMMAVLKRTGTYSSNQILFSIFWLICVGYLFLDIVLSHI